MSDPNAKLAWQVAELRRRLANIVVVGVITELDYQLARARVRVGEIHTQPLPWVTLRAGPDRSWLAPEVGDQVAVMAMSGDLAQGVIMGALYQSAHPAPAAAATVARMDFADGARIEYDRAAHRFTLQLPASGAEIRLVTAGKVTIAADGDITVAAAGAVVVDGGTVAVKGPTTFDDGVTISGGLTVTGATSLQTTTIQGTSATPGGSSF